MAETDLTSTVDAMRSLHAAPLHQQKRGVELVADVKALLAQLEQKIRGEGGDEQSLAEVYGGLEVFGDEALKADIEALCASIEGNMADVRAKLAALGADADSEEAAYTAAERQMRRNMQTALGKRADGLAAEFSDLKRAHGESYERSFGKEVAAKYPLHAAAADGRAEDLVAGMAERQKAGDLPAGNHTAPTRCFLSPQPAEP